MDVLARFRGEKVSRIVLLHVVVAGSFVVARTLESTPATASVLGSHFFESTLGRGLTLALVLASASASVGVLWLSVRARAEPVVWLLLGAWAAALAQRARVDVFDLTYVLVTAIAAAAAFASRRI